MRPLRILALASALLLLSLRAEALDTRAYVTTTDFTSGGLRAATVSPPGMLPGETPVCSDTRMRWFNDRVWVINRFGCDNLQILDPVTLGTIHQWSTGNGSNPADVAFANGRAYVTRYEMSSLLVMNPETGATITTINLAPFADADGIPEMDRMVRSRAFLFVSCQRLDRNHNFQPTDTSLIVVIDTRADTVFDVNPTLPGKQGIVLTGKNPVTPFVTEPGSTDLLVGCVGRYGVLDGGIERIDPIFMTSLGYAITESALLGDVLGIAWNGAAHSYAIVSDAGFNTALVSWNATTHTRIATVYNPGGFSLGDLALDDQAQLWIANNSFFAPGLFVFRAGADTLIAGPLDTGLPPNQITLDHGTGNAAGVEPTRRVRLTVSSPWPNPARTAVRLAVSAPASARLDAAVYDVAGRRVRRLFFGDSRSECAWDLTREDGVAVEHGVYFVRIRAGREQITRSIVVAR